MDECPNMIRFDYERRFGVELELLSFDNRNFKEEPLGKGELPQGIEPLAVLLAEATKKDVSVNKWHLTHNNDSWVLKPDSSCGIEICSPVLKGWHGLKHILIAVNALRTNPKARVDNKCGFHVHFDVSDLELERIAKIVGYWIKCESVFLDSVTESRKRNRYCQPIGQAIFMSDNSFYDASKLLSLVGENKYYTLNSFHLQRGNRNTIEFRIMEGFGCLDPFLIKNWVRLLLHFIESALKKPNLKKFQSNNPWSGYSWLNPKEVFEIMGFFEPLSPGMTETRNWFLSRLKYNIKTNLNGPFSVAARAPAIAQIEELINQFGLTSVDLEKLLRPSDQEQKACPDKNKT